MESAAAQESLDGGAAEIDVEARRRDARFYTICERDPELSAVVETLRAGAFPDARVGGRNGLDYTVFQLACKFSSTRVIRAVLDARESVDARNLDGETCLHIACREGHESVIREILRAGASVAVKDEMRRTPLHYAAEFCSLSGFQGRIRMLLERGAPLGALDMNGQTPIDWARELRNEEGALIMEGEQLRRRAVWRGAKLKWRCWVVTMREELDVEAFLPPVVIRLSRAWAAANPWALLENPALY